MKNIYNSISTLIIIITLLSCNKNITSRTDNIASLDPINQDKNAGTWRSILLTRTDTFAIELPAPVTSSIYIGELNEIKGLQNTLSNEQKENIQYWSAGGVLRWNEILRSLVAKHNLPPYQLEDGTYPIPNAANPFNYPEFPFSNPPYAARAYAYISAAQYDALVACWHYKMLYNRQAPYNYDSIIGKKSFIPKSDLPSYPSEDAVLAGVTAEMMKLLFPTEIAYVERLASEQEYSCLASGKNVRSDVEAGEALGRQIAQVFIARAKTDNASKAIGSPTDWAKIESDCISRGETPWYSLDMPKRPPMLPMFGNVKAFLFDSLTCISLRPPPPPLTSSEQMKKETDEVYNYTKNPSRENIALVQFWADGAGTYTPPGHWNDIAAEDFIKERFSEVRWARNIALLNMALMDASIVCWNTKYYYYNPRPSQLNNEIKTLTGIPNFPAYISGHSTFSGAAATILGHILPTKSNAYLQMANDASTSRLVGGIHYRSDCEAGLETGYKVGNYAIERAKIDGAE